MLISANNNAAQTIDSCIDEISNAKSPDMKASPLHGNHRQYKQCRH